MKQYVSEKITLNPIKLKYNPFKGSISGQNIVEAEILGSKENTTTKGTVSIKKNNNLDSKTKSKSLAVNDVFVSDTKTKKNSDDLVSNNLIKEGKSLHVFRMDSAFSILALFHEDNFLN